MRSPRALGESCDSRARQRGSRHGCDARARPMLPLQPVPGEARWENPSRPEDAAAASFSSSSDSASSSFHAYANATRRDHRALPSSRRILTVSAVGKESSPCHAWPPSAGGRHLPEVARQSELCSESNTSLKPSPPESFTRCSQNPSQPVGRSGPLLPGGGTLSVALRSSPQATPMNRHSDPPPLHARPNQMAGSPLYAVAQGATLLGAEGRGRPSTTAHPDRSP